MHADIIQENYLTHTK